MSIKMHKINSWVMLFQVLCYTITKLFLNSLGGYCQFFSINNNWYSGRQELHVSIILLQIFANQKQLINIVLLFDFQYQSLSLDFIWCFSNHQKILIFTNLYVYSYWNMCTNAIHGQVMINTINRYPQWTSQSTLYPKLCWPVDTQPTLHQHLGWQSTDFESVDINWSTLGRPSINWDADRV